MKKLITVLLTAMYFITSSAYATDKFKDAVRTYDAGNYTQAIKLFKQLALKGDADAQHNLGVMYNYGQGVAQNYTEAVKWYKLAAAQGDAAAQFNLALKYDDGQGVAQDYAEAV